MQKVDKETFVEIWNNSANLDEAAKLTGYSRLTVASKASQLRGEQYQLKKMYPSSEVYRRIGAIGGRNGTTGGFASTKVGADGMTGKQRASVVGTVGGTKSRR